MSMCRTVLTATSSLTFLFSMLGCTESDGIPAPAPSTPPVALTEPVVTPASVETTSSETPLPTKDSPATQAEPSTDGVWKVQVATMAGTAMPKAVTDTISLTLTGENYLVMVGESPDKGTCVVDRSVTPHQMKITGTEGPNAGKTILAIFDFPDATTMRVCYDLNGTAFPSSFDSTPENTLYSVTYTR